MKRSNPVWPKALLVFAIVLLIVGSVIDFYHVSYSEVLSDGISPEYRVEHISGLKDGLFCLIDDDYFESNPESGFRFKLHFPVASPILVFGFMDPILGISTWVIAILFAIPFLVDDIKKKTKSNQRVDLTVKTPVESVKAQGTAGHP